MRLPNLLEPRITKVLSIKMRLPKLMETRITKAPQAKDPREASNFGFFSAKVLDRPLPSEVRLRSQASQTSLQQECVGFSLLQNPEVNKPPRSEAVAPLKIAAPHPPTTQPATQPGTSGAEAQGKGCTQKPKTSDDAYKCSSSFEKV